MNLATIRSSTGYLSVRDLYRLCMHMHYPVCGNALFLTMQNMLIVLRQVSINGILAIGVTFVIIAGGIDLSLGSVLALTGVVAAGFAHPGTHALIVPVMLGILTGIIIVLKWFDHYVGKSGRLLLRWYDDQARGLALVWAMGAGYQFVSLIQLYWRWRPDAYSRAHITVYTGDHYIAVFKIPYRPLYLCCWGNENAARASGIRVNRVKLFAYLMCGGLAGLPSIVLAARITTGQPCRLAPG